MSKYLSNNNNIFIVDYKDGCMGRQVPINVNFIDIETVTRYPESSILVLQSVAPWNISDIEKFPPETRILYWNLHPLNLFPLIFSIYSKNKFKRILAYILQPISFFRRRKLAKIITYLSDNNSLIFMDEENFNKTSLFYPNIKISRSFLPILSAPGNLTNRIPTNILRCCWIGRVVDFKVHILLHLIERLNVAVAKVGAIQMIVVGDGDSIEYLKEVAKKNQNIEIQFIPNVLPCDLDSFLINNVDVLFAMGTSALEGASRAIPTFLLDYSYFPISDLYRFQLFQTKLNYTLGEEIGSQHKENISSLENELNVILSKYREVGLKEYESWRLKFSPEVILHKFENNINSATSTVKIMKSQNYFEPDLLSILIKKCIRKFKTKNNIHGFNEY